MGSMATSESSSHKKGGTKVRFKPDSQIFKEKLDFDPNIILNRMKELAFLNSTATFKFRCDVGVAKKLKGFKSGKRKSEDDEKSSEESSKFSTIVTENGVEYVEEVLSFPGGVH